ncbi:MAG: Trans-aconitate 2-methyltransferase [Verrucomicrobiae bacterium]|nr:Trans-aconitate 2-methyltransferase [Verrucomicrobiae bacterium]
MERIVEPELMTEADQARAYAAANFEEAHARYPRLFQKVFPDCPPTGHALDLGCGPGDVTRRFARILPGWRFDAVDGSPAMLAHAPASATIRYIEGFLPGVSLPCSRYDLVLCSSLLHHLHNPAVLWETIRQHTGPGSLVFVVDLRRPASRAAAEKIVREQTSGEPEVLRRDYLNSLLAAFTPAEVRQQLRAAGLANLRVKTIGARHLMVAGVITSNPLPATARTSDSPATTGLR